MSDLLKGLRQYRMHDDEVYCIAYGSNLSEARMKSRCPGAQVFGTSLIIGYRLLFKQSMTGAYATIEQDANCEVPVLVYQMSAMDEMLLDRYEGYPKYYRKQEFFLPIWCLNGKKRKNRRHCIAYVMREERLLGCPSHDYYRLLDDGYRRWGFDPLWIRKALSDSIGAQECAGWLKKYNEEGSGYE